MSKGVSSGDSSLNQKSESDDNSDLLLHDALLAAASRQLSEREYKFGGKTEYPTLNAMAVRAAYFGIQGRLLPSLEQIQGAMNRSGPIGAAAVERMENLAKLGWEFGPILPSDPFVASESSATLGRIGKMLSLGGYNDARSGKIAFNALGSMMNTISGISSGADVDVANKYIHELAHGKYSAGYQLCEGPASAIEALHSLPHAAQVEHGNLMVQEELRAISAQSIANLSRQSPFSALLPQSKGLANYTLESSLRTGETGSLVKGVWNYEGTKYLSVSEANLAGRSYVQNNYGTLFNNGRVNLEAKQAIAAEIRALPLDAPGALKSPLLAQEASAPLLKESSAALVAKSAETAFSAPQYFKYVSNAGQGLAAVTALVAIADLRGQFNRSAGSGFGRIASVGSDWIGFEGGLAAGTWVGEAATNLLIKVNPKLAMFALPVISMASGLAASQVVHDKISQPMGWLTQREIDALLEHYKTK